MNEMLDLLDRTQIVSQYNMLDRVSEVIYRVRVASTNVDLSHSYRSIHCTQVILIYLPFAWKIPLSINLQRIVRTLNRSF
jgi:hypothetical protein